MPICKKCFEAVKECAQHAGYELTNEEVVAILWQATPFPAGCMPEVGQAAQRFFQPSKGATEKPPLSRLFELVDFAYDCDMERVKLKAAAAEPEPRKMQPYHDDSGLRFCTEHCPQWDAAPCYGKNVGAGRLCRPWAAQRFLTGNGDLREGDIVLAAGEGGASILLRSDGTIFVNGRMAASDKEVYEHMRVVTAVLYKDCRERLGGQPNDND